MSSSTPKATPPFCHAQRQTPTTTTPKADPSTQIDGTIVKAAGMSYPSSPTASHLQTSADPSKITENTRTGESIRQSFTSALAPQPSEILPSLYISNLKTATAYILGKTDSSFPPISRIVTVLTQVHIPDPRGSGRDIERLVIEKYDEAETKLIEDFDKTGEFIHNGMQACVNARECEAIDGIRGELKRLQVRDRINQVVQRVSMTDMSTPISPVVGLNEHMRSRTTTATSTSSNTPIDLAQGATSRSSRTSSVSSPYDTNLTLTPHVTTPADKVAAPGGVLIHCYAGISRSATVAAAYLLKYHPHLFTPPPTTISATPSTPERHAAFLAISFLQSKRPIVNPNIGFREQLSLYWDLGCALKDERGLYKGMYLDWWEEQEQEVENRVVGDPGVRKTGKKGAGAVRSVFEYDDEGLCEPGTRAALGLR